MTVGSVVRGRGSVLVAPLVHFLYIYTYPGYPGVLIGTALLPRWIATVASTSVRPVAGTSVSSGAYRRVPQVAGAMRRVSYRFLPYP